MTKHYMEGNYRPRVMALLTKKIKGETYILANRIEGEALKTNSPYNFPGGGTEGEPLIRAARKEALEEVGYRINRPRVIQKPITYQLSTSWQDHIKKKRGVQAKGIINSIVHGRLGKRDMSLYGSEGDAIKGVKLHLLSEVIDSTHKFTERHRNTDPNEVHPYVAANRDIVTALRSIEKRSSVRNRDYRKEYLRDHAHKEAKDNRVKRNYWNRKISTPPGKEIDHKVPLSRGGGNGRSNLRVTSVSANRSKGVKTASRYAAITSALDQHGLNTYMTLKDQQAVQDFALKQRDRARRTRERLRGTRVWRKLRSE
jgi:8-oxo-dGTP pyrophosphatase MutT (NUDIX family)